MSIVIAVVFLFVIGITIYLRWKKRASEKEYQMEIKIRNDKLNELLDNVKSENRERTSLSPYEVKYHPVSQRTSARKDTFFQLIEKNSISERNYLFSKEEEVYIGVRGNETVVLKCENQNRAVCKIYGCQDQICIKTLSDMKVILQRKKRQTFVQKNGIILKDHDVIKIMDSEFWVLF